MLATRDVSQALRVDGPQKVTGRARYAADVRLPGLLVGVALRSPLPHALIRRIDASAARDVPGVHAVLTAADLPPVLLGKGTQDLPLLARDRVRFVGERVAAVAAESRDAAEEALQRIRVEYEELPAVFDPLEALRPEAPVLHPERESYHRHYDRDPFSLPEHPNASSRLVQARGDVAEGFARSAHVFEDVFRVPMQHVGFLEPHSCTVALEASGRVLVWSCVKQPFAVRQWLAQATGVDARQIVVLPTLIGGDFGGKGYLVDEPLAYFLARTSGRPVQMVMTYNEEFLAGIPRHAAVLRIKSGLDAEGRLLAREVEAVFNNGAYAGLRPRATLMGVWQAAGPYRIPHVRIASTCVYTNQVPCGHMRAPGQPQAVFAVESHTDLLARRLGLDPLEFRRRNLLREGDERPLGGVARHVTVLECAERAARAIGWHERRQADRADGHLPSAIAHGRGLAVCERGTGSGRSVVAVEVDEQGRVTVHTGVPEIGTGAHTVLRQVVARVLGLDPSAVAVVQGDTAEGPYDSGSGGSKVTNSAGGVALAAATALRERLCSLAAEAEGWREGNVTLQDGVFRGDDARAVPFAELAGRLARQEEGGLIREEADGEGPRGGGSAYACHAVEVAVDRETGQVRVERVIAVHDVGYVVHQLGATGQIEGGLVQAFGQALMEELRVADGRVQPVNLADYKLPNIQDVSPLVLDLIQNGDGPGPFGSKGVGELPAVPTAAAIANAVEDAVGVRIAELPLTAEKVLRALRSGSARPPDAP